MTIKLLKYEIYKIHILPFGFLIECNMNKNRSLKEDLLVYLSGIIVNIIISLFIIIFKLNKFYLYINIGLILFNILPIIPLDGGRVLISVMAYKIRYKKVLFCSNVISLSILMIIFIISIYFKDINMILMSLYLLMFNIKTLKNYKKNYNEFLLGKYLYPNYYLKYHYVKIEEVGVYNNYFKGKNNLFINNKKKYYEKDVLEKKYKDKKTLS